MNKIWAIARKDLYTRFTDRNLLLLMIAAPLAISTIVGLVFGSFGDDGGGLTLSDIPVAIVNLDEGAVQQGQTINYGADLVTFLVGGESGNSQGQDISCALESDSASDGGESTTTIGDLIAAEQLEDVAVGRAGVENGDYAALIVVPSNFSQWLTPNIGAVARNGETPAVEVYANSGQPIEGAVVRSVAEGFTNRLLTGNIAIEASINTVIAQNPIAALQLAADQDNPELGSIFACGFSDTLATVSVEPQAVDSQDETGGRSLVTLILVQTGSGQAAIFALFAAQFGVLSIIEERRAGTLQRMLTTPTPRSAILAGKLFGTLVTAVFQLVLLMLALTIIASVVEGQLTLIWGSNVLALAAIVLTLSLAVAGLGVLLTGIARTPEQVGPIGAIINIILGLLGGSFGVPPALPLAYVSMIYWSTDAFSRLAVGNLDIVLHVLVLLAQGVALFGIGIFLFSRRVEV